MAQARSLRGLLSTGRTRLRGRLTRPVTLARRVVELVPDTEHPRVAVLDPAVPGLVEALRVRIPRGSVVVIPAAPSARATALAAFEPFDVIVDSAARSGRLRRFRDCFYRVRAGGAYVVPGGADELGASPGPLGRLLQASFALPAHHPLRQRNLRRRVAERRAIRHHVSARAAAGDLVLGHDLVDVFMKVREETFDGLLPQLDAPHRVLSVLPAAAPEPPDFREMPEPRRKFSALTIRAVPLSLRDYREVVVAPNQVVLGDGIVLPDSYRHHPKKRLSNMVLVDVTPRFVVPVVGVPADPPRLSGTFVHLDNESRGHFGHLLTESVSRAWTWPEGLRLDPEARVILGRTRKRPELLDYELLVYEACGIPRDRIVLIDGPVRVERLIAGTPMFSNPHYVHPRIAETWQQVGDRLAARASPREWPRRIFVSRRQENRRCLNQAEVEAIFVEHGFEVVFPEDHPLGEQVQMFRDAEVIAGYAGSGMFQLEFVPDPKRVILVGSSAYNPRNEYLMAAVRRHRIDMIVCLAEKRHVQGDYRYDEEREGPHLRPLLAELGSTG